VDCLCGESLAIGSSSGFGEGLVANDDDESCVVMWPDRANRPLTHLLT
jgi:hypothetical protein